MVADEAVRSGIDQRAPTGHIGSFNYDAPRGEMNLLCREPIFNSHREVKYSYYVG